MTRRTIDDFYAAIRTQDLDGIASWFTPTARHRIYSAAVSGQRAFAGDYDGVAAIRARFERFRDVWTIRSLDVSNLTRDGVKFAADIELHAVSKSGLRTFSVTSVHFLMFEDDLIADFDIFINEILFTEGQDELMVSGELL